MKKCNPIKTLSGIALLIILVAAANLQAAEDYCGELDPAEQYGPYDYSNPTHRKKHLPIVEVVHFTSDVKNLIKGESGTIAGDIDYTLRAFPNHYKALQSLVRLKLRDKTGVELSGLKYSVECYFDRAIRFRPGDGVVRMLYANYLLKLKGRSENALEQYQEAVRVQPNSATINYNIGLLYLKRKNYEESVAYAKKAYGLGFPLPGLRNKLKRAGKWDGKLDENTNEKKEENADHDLQE